MALLISLHIYRKTFMVEGLRPEYTYLKYVKLWLLGLRPVVMLDMFPSTMHYEINVTESTEL